MHNGKESACQLKKKKKKKNLPADAGDARDEGSVPRLRRFPGVGNGSPLQYFFLENSMDRQA